MTSKPLFVYGSLMHNRVLSAAEVLQIYHSGN